MNNRIDKINSLLEHEIGNIILRDFTFDAMVTLTRVDTTPNLIEARAYVSVLPEEKSDKVIKILKQEVSSVQQKINKKLNMRPIPKIIFRKDEKIAEAARVEELLNKLKKEEN